MKRAVAIIVAAFLAAPAILMGGEYKSVTWDEELYCYNHGTDFHAQVRANATALYEDYTSAVRISRLSLDLECGAFRFNNSHVTAEVLVRDRYNVLQRVALFTDIDRTLSRRRHDRSKCLSIPANTSISVPYYASLIIRFKVVITTPRGTFTLPIKERLLIRRR